jgi:hypothetical protein
MLLAELGELRLQDLFFFVGHGTGEPLLELGAQQGAICRPSLRRRQADFALRAEDLHPNPQP